jgi:hypothetical protein
VRDNPTWRDAIPPSLIEQAEVRDACLEAMRWLRARRRTYADLAKREAWLDWSLTHLTLPREVWVMLATDDDGDVRRRVAGNPSTPPAVLERLATDDDGDVRRRVAEHPSTPPAVLERLATDADDYVRRGVAGNPSTPPAVAAKARA